MEKIFIIGAGAIGKALAVFLKQQQKDVVLLRGSTDNINPYHEQLEVVLSEDSIVKSTVEISTLSNYQTLAGVIVLTNKAFGNFKLAGDLRDKAGSSPIVILQNGLNVETPFLEDFNGIYRCVLFATSQVLSTTTIRFKPVSVSPIGVLKGTSTELDRVVKALDSVNFRFKAVDNIQEIIWRKVIANCVFNSICPLLETDNGIFHRDADALTLAKLVVAECATIARATGINLKDADIMDTIVMISQSSDGQLISTLQDIKNRRETEIESLNFAIVKIASELNAAHLVSTTRVLGELVRLKSKIVQG